MLEFQYVAFTKYIQIMVPGSGPTPAGPVFEPGDVVILDVVCRYLSLFMLFIDVKIGKNIC